MSHSDHLSIFFKMVPAGLLNMIMLVILGKNQKLDLFCST